MEASKRKLVSLFNCLSNGNSIPSAAEGDNEQAENPKNAANSLDANFKTSEASTNTTDFHFLCELTGSKSNHCEQIFSVMSKLQQEVALLTEMQGNLKLEMSKLTLNPFNRIPHVAYAQAIVNSKTFSFCPTDRERSALASAKNLQDVVEIVLLHFYAKEALKDLSLSGLTKDEKRIKERVGLPVVSLAIESTLKKFPVDVENSPLGAYDLYCQQIAERQIKVRNLITSVIRRYSK